MALPACTFVSWKAVHQLGRLLARQIAVSGFRPDIVVAIGRGGYVPARVVCDFLHLDQLAGIKVEHYVATRKQDEVTIRYPLNCDVRDRNVLVVDDVNDSGDTLAAVARYIEAFKPAEVKLAVMHEKRVTMYPADFVAKYIKKWRWLVYPWACVEDVTTFVQVLSPPPKSTREAMERLWHEHGIRVAEQTMRDVMDFLPFYHPDRDLKGGGGRDGE